MRKLTDVFSTCWERLDDDDTDVRAAREQAIGKLAPLRVQLEAAMRKAGLRLPGETAPPAGAIDVD